MTASSKRYKPKREVKAATRPAKRADFERMAQGCLDAIVQGYTASIIMSFPYFVKFEDKTFPKGMLIEQTPTSNVYKVKVQKLLDWLHKNGYSRYDYKEAMGMKIRASMKVARMEQEVLDKLRSFVP